MCIYKCIHTYKKKTENRHDDLFLSAKKHRDGLLLQPAEENELACNFGLIVQGDIDLISQAQCENMCAYILRRITRDSGFNFFESYFFVLNLRFDQR